MSIGLVNGLQNGDSSSLINTPWIDFSEQSTIVGWSSYTFKQIRYRVVGKQVFVIVDLRGTSNSTTTTFTLPYLGSIAYSQLIYLGGLIALDNGTGYHGYCNISNSATVTAGFWTTATNSTVTWTASGTKNIRGQFFYQID